MHEKIQDDGPELSVVVPVYNEADLIDELVERCVKACDSCTASYEIVFVNDGSRDATLENLLVHAQKRRAIVVVNLSRNFGHMHALSAGLDHARGRAAVVIDGDLQDPPEVIPDLVKAWRDGAETVLARRTLRREGLLQRALTAVFYRLLRQISHVPLPEQVGTFSLLDRRVIDVLSSIPERLRYFAGLRAWAGFKTATVPYKREKRRRGASMVGFSGRFALARMGIVSFSNWPLIWLSRFSLLISGGLFFFGLAVTGIRLFSNLAIPGWASNMVLIGTVSSVNSLVFAIFAEYLSVIFDEIKHRPLFVTEGVYRNGMRIDT